MILEGIFQWSRQWLYLFPSRCQSIEPLSRCSFCPVDAIQFDPMKGKRNVEVPAVAGMSDHTCPRQPGSDCNILPCRANRGGLCIVNKYAENRRGMIDEELTLCHVTLVDGVLNVPLGTIDEHNGDELLRKENTPFDPVTATIVSPARQFDVSVVVEYIASCTSSEYLLGKRNSMI